jgi:hypothetical protein
MNVLQIIKIWLKDNGYDGLCSTDCGCSLDNLAPCDREEIAECEPGYKNPCPGPGKCERYDPKIRHDHIEPTKPKEKP